MLKYEYLKPFTGKKLKSLSDSRYFNNLYGDLIFDSVEKGIIGIRNRYRIELNSLGTNCKELVDFRNEVYNSFKGDLDENHFVLTIPHTHWENYEAIVYKLVPDKYIIGHHPIDDISQYYPVSFVFDTKNIYPYEWICGKPKNFEEFLKLYKTIVLIYENTSLLNLPFGLSINFRFRENFGIPPVANIEHPIIEDGKISSFSEILRAEEYEKKYPNEHTEQVTWSLKSELSLGLKKEEMEIFNSLQNYLSNLPTIVEQKKFLSTLKKIYI